MSQSEAAKPDSITIRPMTRDDIPKLTLMEAEIFPDPWPEKAFIEELDRDNRGILIAQIDGNIVGYAGLIVSFGEAHLTNIAVAPDYRGKSVAKTLLSGILENAKKADCKYIFLDVRPSNTSAIDLYQKFGFYELYRRPNYYRVPVEDAVVMVKDLWEEST